jgi:16S rRNA C967 or C1407 C5-methylase (RsmB/RsmF family)
VYSAYAYSAYAELTSASHLIPACKDLLITAGLYRGRASRLLCLILALLPAWQSMAAESCQSGWGPARDWGGGKGQGVPSGDGTPPTLPENHARKKRPPRNNEKFFKDYYSEQLGCLADEDRAAMFKCLETPLPVTFRLVGPLQKDSSAHEADRYHKQLCDLLAAGTKESEGLKLGPEALERMDWYPQQAAWKLNVGKKDMKKVEHLQTFLLQETAAGRLVRMEAVSMIPALVLDACPGEFVLDMCAAPGSKTGMCLEMVMHSRASGSAAGQMNSIEREQAMGAVIANDPDLSRSKMMVHRTKALCSPSLVVTALPGQTFPELTSKTGEAIQFDRVLCDVPCSGDGTLRKAPYNLRTWHVSHPLLVCRAYMPCLYVVLTSRAYTLRVQARVSCAPIPPPANATPQARHRTHKGQTRNPKFETLNPKP